MVARLDRLSRSVLDFATVMGQARDEGWVLVALDLGVDTSQPSGQLVAHVVAAVADYEGALMGERTREAMAAARARGVHVGRPRIDPRAGAGPRARAPPAGAWLRGHRPATRR